MLQICEFRVSFFNRLVRITRALKNGAVDRVFRLTMIYSSLTKTIVVGHSPLLERVSNLHHGTLLLYCLGEKEENKTSEVFDRSE
jgi:hypothetical protein